MIKVKTYVLNPNVQYPGIVDQELFNNYFFDIEDQNNVEIIKRVFKKEGNIYACILITHNDKVILNDEVMERIPLYWIIWTDMIEDYLTMSNGTYTVSIEPYFALTKSADGTIILKYGDEAFSFELPEKEFLITVLQGGESFFGKYHMLCPDANSISVVEKIIRLIPLVRKL